jgi:methionyl-tRNA synthetase
VRIPDSDHVFYVWIDALTNYLTVLGYPNDMKTVHQFWPHSLHLVGKDILRFHAVYWPALLMAAQLPPPSRIFAHGWWMHDGQKMSKSLGNVIDPINMIDDYGIDRVRYFLFRHVRFGQDGDFSTNLFVQKCNQELADGLGNLAHRTLTFIHNRMGGMVPRIEKTTLDDQGQDLITWGQNHYQYWVQMMNEQDLFSYLESIYAGIQKGNQYIDHRAPWTLMKKANQGCAHSQNQVNNIMYALLSIIRDIAVALYPVIPQSSQALWTQLGYTTPLSDHNNLQGLLQKEMDPETPLPRPTPLFQKMDDAMHTS